MNVFISYSGHDTNLVGKIAAAVEAVGHDVDWWQESNVPGKDSWSEIFGWIDDADLVLAIITDNAVSRGMAMGAEIGYAIANKITIIPLVSAGIRQEDIGCLIGMTHVPLDERNLAGAIAAIMKSIRRERGEQWAQLAKFVLGAALTVALGRKISL